MNQKQEYKTENMTKKYKTDNMTCLHDKISTF